ncbi:MAG TPA: gas vesicle protein GvpH [Halococcus sp.]|nr:gas vesicle protein GvpH [Halococcus sp.]
MTKNDNERANDNSGIIRTILSDVFESIADMDERNQRRRSATGSARRGRSRFDYGFSIGIGPQADERGDANRTPATADTDHSASIHETNEGAVVTLDVPDIDPRGLSAGVDSSARMLVVAVENEVIERVSLPRGDLEVRDASFNNGILDVYLQESDI